MRPYLGIEVAVNLLPFHSASVRHERCLIVDVEALLLKILVHCSGVFFGEREDGELRGTYPLILEMAEGREEVRVCVWWEWHYS